MRLKDSPVQEAKRFLRATQVSFDTLTEGSSGSEFTVTYGISLQTQPVTASEVKSMLSAIEQSLKAFANEGIINVQLDINHQNGFDGSLIKDTKNAYEASKKIEEVPSKQEAAG